MDLENRIAELAGPGATAAGLVVDGVRIGRESGLPHVLVTVDLPPDAIGSAPMDDVAAASRAISAALDEAGVPEGPHVLEVSTPGLSRPLTERHHFARARTRLATLVLADGAEATGYITDVADAGVTIDVEGTARVVAWEAIASGRIEIDMRRKD